MIACWFTRQKIACCLDSGSAPEAKTQSHLDHCPGCAAEYRRQQALVRRLSEEAKTIDPVPPLQFRERVMAAIDRLPVPNGEPAPTRLPFRSLAWSVAALALIATLIFAWQRPEPPPSAPVRLTQALQTSTEWLRKEKIKEQLNRWSLILEQPLKSEYQLAKLDIIHTINGLVEEARSKDYLAPLRQ